jgi:hypothetical protein
MDITVDDVHFYQRALSEQEIDILAQGRMRGAPIRAAETAYAPLDRCDHGTSVAEGTDLGDHTGSHTVTVGELADPGNNTGRTCDNATMRLLRHSGVW